MNLCLPRGKAAGRLLWVSWFNNFSFISPGWSAEAGNADAEAPGPGIRYQYNYWLFNTLTHSLLSSSGSLSALGLLLCDRDLWPEPGANTKIWSATHHLPLTRKLFLGFKWLQTIIDKTESKSRVQSPSQKGKRNLDSGLSLKSYGPPPTHHHP